MLGSHYACDEWPWHIAAVVSCRHNPIRLEPAEPRSILCAEVCQSLTKPIKPERSNVHDVRTTFEMSVTTVVTIAHNMPEDVQ